MKKFFLQNALFIGQKIVYMDALKAAHNGRSKCAGWLWGNKWCSSQRGVHFFWTPPSRTTVEKVKYVINCNNVNSVKFNSVTVKKNKYLFFFKIIEISAIENPAQKSRTEVGSPQAQGGCPPPCGVRRARVFVGSARALGSFGLHPVGPGVRRPRFLFTHC